MLPELQDVVFALFSIPLPLLLPSFCSETSSSLFLLDAFHISLISNSDVNILFSLFIYLLEHCSLE